VDVSKVIAGQTDVVVDGPEGNALAFHSLLHPNLNDFLATSKSGQILCNGGADSCIGVYDHTPLNTSRICPTPLESASNDLLQPVSFSADEKNNVFTIFSDGGLHRLSGRLGYSSVAVACQLDFGNTSSTTCSNSMKLTRLIPQEISAAHSMS
jgi:hypothetical protein